jgi:hypothetical protein
MKGIYLFLIVFTLAWAFPALGTKGFTYLYGELNPFIKIWAWSAIGIIYVLSLCIPIAVKWALKTKYHDA